MKIDHTISIFAGALVLLFLLSPAKPLASSPSDNSYNALIASHDDDIFLAFPPANAELGIEDTQILKIGPSGETLNKTPVHTDQLLDLKIDPQGFKYLLSKASISDTLNIIKLSIDNSILWELPIPSETTHANLKIDSQQNVFYNDFIDDIMSLERGTTFKRISPQGGELWHKSFRDEIIHLWTINTAGNITYITQKLDSDSSFMNALYLTTLDQMTGEEISSKKLMTLPFQQTLRDFILTKDSGLIFLLSESPGEFSHGKIWIIRKTDADGHQVWENSLAGIEDKVQVSRIKESRDGRIFVLGTAGLLIWTNNPEDGRRFNKTILWEFSPEGALLRKMPIITSDGFEAYDFEITPNDQLTLIGTKYTQEHAYMNGAQKIAMMKYDLRRKSDEFIRGDADDDGQLNITDAIYTLRYLFLGGSLNCFQAADANDDGTVNISDAITILNFLFLGGSAIPAPYPHYGPDPTPDTLTCEWR